MGTETGEQVLQSFLNDDESLLTTVTVQAVQRGFTTTPPQLEESVTVGVTGDRVLWFDDELSTIEQSSIDRLERDTVSHRSAPTIVRIGSFAMIAGIVAALVGGLFAGQSLPVSLGLATAGIGVFAVTIAVARVRGDTGDGFEKHRLAIETDDELVQLWGVEAALGQLHGALDEYPP